MTPPMRSEVAQAVGRDLAPFGGFLQCLTCGSEQELGDVGNKLAHGWPKCCGHTMRWWTQRQIDAGEPKRRDAR